LSLQVCDILIPRLLSTPPRKEEKIERKEENVSRIKLTFNNKKKNDTNCLYKVP
jgi:hypothetical protein